MDAIEQLEWALWCTLMCRCDRCERMLDLSQFDSLLGRSPAAWAAKVAPIVAAQGWCAPTQTNLLCPQCKRVEC